MCPISVVSGGRLVLEPDSHLLLNPSDERWVDLVASMPEANIFHHPAWIGLLAECYGYHPFVVAVCDSDGRISAGLPIMEVNSFLTGRRWVALPFSDHCAPLYRDGESLSHLTNALVHLSRNERTPRIELRWEFPAHAAIRSRSRYVRHTIRLSSDAEAVASRFHREHRRRIKVAKKKGVRIEWGDKREHLRIFYRHQLHTRRRHGVPVQPWRFFDLLGSAIVEKGLGFVLLAYKDDECLAGAVFLHWQQTLTSKYSASSTKARSLQPNYLLFWTAICWGCENGYTLLDRGRTDLSDTGLREFKNRWGAKEVPLTYSTLSATPLEPKINRLMPMMQTVIRNSPAWFCKATGELLYRHFG
jgi:CelD/BcsL family acetyltransferase involved in cellulose biosynthesis